MRKLFGLFNPVDSTLGVDWVNRKLINVANRGVLNAAGVELDVYVGETVQEPLRDCLGDQPAGVVGASVRLACRRLELA